MFVYHGGSMPETEEQQAAVMAAWDAWYRDPGESIADGGAPVAPTKMVAAGGAVSDTIEEIFDLRGVPKECAQPNTEAVLAVRGDYAVNDIIRKP